MVISFELHSDWLEENILEDSKTYGISFGKHSHFHYKGVTGIYVVMNRMLTIEIIEKPSRLTKKELDETLSRIARKLIRPRKG